MSQESGAQSSANSAPELADYYFQYGEVADARHLYQLALREGELSEKRLANLLTCCFRMGDLDALTEMIENRAPMKNLTLRKRALSYCLALAGETEAAAEQFRSMAAETEK